ncbi:peroxisomal acyl-coenzyme A thioester hydrolase 1 [[Candida] railenensis]|uniref:Peroxisomal acyl-coenzyme A thioester hydrolase 1 n=1 Tax=[Candida] railenensis TaxID=45579 RepID=A0A9P0VYR3_9ASCO|nr:peroxisomal acyl-coenzyme A thioester hydrolase 1 [[Candida] railenensis]
MSSSLPVLPIPERDEHSSHMENKFELIKLEENVYQGKYPLETFMAGARGTYGGEFVSQSMLAGWATVENPEFTPHSFHSYFVKAGSLDSPMKYVVSRNNDGRNFANRSVHVYQSTSNILCFVMIISFTRKNTLQKKIDFFKSDLTKKAPIPFEIQGSPHYFIKKYAKQLDTLPSITSTNDNLQHILPPEYFDLKRTKNTIDQQTEPGDRKLGFFVRCLDDLTKAKNPTKSKYVDLGFLSDSFYLSAIVRVLGLPFKYKNLQFFRVSLDHSVYFHDTDFDPTVWMFMDFKFSRYSNDRLLCNCQLFTMDGRLVATINQEALVYLSNEIINNIPSHSKKSKIIKL